MLYGDDIGRLVSLLQERDVWLWHACQFLDFQSYLALGGIPSRSCLQLSGLPFTAFETDQTDRRNGVWDKVFLNLSDFGEAFAKGRRAVPNAFGPIIMEISPTALLDATDIAVCLRSAGAKDFDRSTEALTSVEQIDRLFRYAANEEPPRSSYLKYKEELQKWDPRAQQPEVSCTFPNGQLSMERIRMICVDPYRFHNRRLIDFVDEALKHAEVDIYVEERRNLHTSRSNLYTELAKVLEFGVPTLKDLIRDESLSANLQTWSEVISQSDPSFQYGRYAKYLRKGTLLPILNYHSA